MLRAVHPGEAEHPTVQNRVTPWSEGVMFELQVQFCVAEKWKRASNGSVAHVAVLVLEDGKHVGVLAEFEGKVQCEAVMSMKQRLAQCEKIREQFR